MRNVRPTLTFILLVFVQSLCVLPGQAPAPVTSTPISAEMAIAATQTAASSIQVTEPIQAIATPQADSVGTINLVASQVETGPLENLQFLEGLQDFHNGDAVRVTGGGKGELALDDGTQLLLFNDTQLDRVEVNVSPNETRIRLVDQGLDGYVPPGEPFIAEMPNGAVITILGTNFIILYDADTQVATAGNFDGTVLYALPNGTEEELPPGRIVNIPAQGAGVLTELPFTPQDFEAAVDSSGTPTAGLAALVEQYQIEPIVFTGEEVAGASGGSAAFSPDGKYVVSAGCDEESFDCDRASVRVWEALTGNEVTPRFTGTEEGYLSSVTFSPDGRHVAFENAYGAVIVWNPFSGQEVARLVEDDSGSIDFAFSPDGNYIVTGGPDDTVRIWETLTGNLVTSMTHERAWNVAFGPDGRYVVSGGQADDYTVRLWEVSTSSEVASMPQRAVSDALVFSPDGRYVASGGCDDGGQFCTLGTARVLDVSARREITSITHDGWVLSIAFSPDSKYIVSGSSGDGVEGAVTGSLVIWEAATGTEIVRRELDSWVGCVDYSPDGDYVVFGTDDGNIRVLDAFTGREVAHMSHAEQVLSVDFSPDGKYVLAASVDGVVRVWRWQIN
jgi:WD40 repeat protein